MVESSTSKLLQKRAYDILSQRYGLIVLLCSCMLFAASVFQFGEALIEWSEEKYATVFNSFSDNIAGRSYRKRLCLPVPIDVVYTWVNGSDPALLYELRKYKQVVEVEVNATKKEQGNGCHFANCVPTKFVVVDPAFPSVLDKKTISILYPSFKTITRMLHMTNPAKENATVTVLEFATTEELEIALKEDVKIGKENATLKQAYYTTDWTLPNSLMLQDTVMMMGFPDTMSTEDLRTHLPKKYLPTIDKITIYGDKGIAIITINQKEDMEKFLEDGNITVDGKVQSVESANLLWDLRDYSAGEQIGANRYQDNEELRYSMRSLEQHAPWVRQIFLVTNGQIPGWLNLDNPRLTLVTHDEIFSNKSHLPTFSSPAIESNIHRIPGLSDKFIYMNDDVMFGRDVWPDDFFTHSTGQKIYLTWPVPNCQDGCPQSWIRDGYCDKACNNSECEWDGGDCAGGAGANQGWNLGGWGQENEAEYCNSGCANNWLADRYCDQSCNVPQCGFDAGDCGVDNFHQLTQIVLDREITHYELPPGEMMAYFNLTAFLGPEGKIEDGAYDEAKVIRNVAVAKKFRVLHILLQKDHARTNLNFSITADLGGAETFKFNFTLTVNTNATKVIVEQKKEEKKDEEAKEDGEKKEEQVDEVDKFIAENLPEFDHIDTLVLAPKKVQFSPVAGVVQQVNLSHYVLPDDIETRLRVLKTQLADGDLTQKGFETRQSALWDEYYERLQAEGRQPEKATQKLAPNEPEDAQNVVQMEPNNVQGNVESFGDQQQQQQQQHVGVEPLNQPQAMNQQQQNMNQQQQNMNQHQQQNVGLESFNQQAAFEQQQFVNQQPVFNEPPNLNQQGQFAQNANMQPADANPQFAPVDTNMQAAQQDQNLQDGGQWNNDYNNGNPVNAQGAPNLQGGGLQPQDANVIQGQDEQVQGEQGQNVVQRDLGQNVDVGGDHQYDVDDTHKSRKLNGLSDNAGFLPWEKQGLFDDLVKKKEQIMAQAQYTGAVYKTRDLLDKFSDSLRHVNKLYNTEYGYAARSVPGHMPHLIDRNVMIELQEKFADEWAETSSHKVRHSRDMQFSFSYFYYVMSEPNRFSAEDVFAAMDTDSSGILSDREIRTLATRVYELPLDLDKLTSLENMLTNCSKHMAPDPALETLQHEEYYDKNMPQVTMKLFATCGPMVQLVKKNFHAGTKYKYEIMKDEDIAFKMIKTNVSSVVGQLDDIRRDPKKFICLNDDIDHSREEAKTTKAVLQDFYESLFPVASSFELPREYRNRFLHIQELRDWRYYRDWLKLWTQVALCLLILFTISSFFSDKIESFQRRYLGRRTQTRANAEPSTLQTV